MRIARRMSDITILKNVADLFASNVVKELVVAIDPGYSIGIAILANDAPVLTNIQISLEKSIVWIKRQLDELNYTNLQIKIGDGWKETLEEYVMRFSQEFGNYAEILLVDEVNTSIKLKQELGIHERAAIAIGLREGRPV
ncbi:MAG: hypothetical protein ACXAE3_07020 [Candidatus Kariarchaeaceae archaeon]|jgi:hypothetical protein